jgi:hypothetical protein
VSAFLDLPVPACDIRPGDRLVPSVGSVRLVREVDHRDRSLITVDGFDAPELWDLETGETVTLRCPPAATDGWDYYAGPQPGSVLHCSCVYRRDRDGQWSKAITLPDCAWCNPTEED